MKLRGFQYLVGLMATLAVGTLSAQQPEHRQRISLAGVRTFAVHSEVQLTKGAALEPINSTLLRARIEQAVRWEGISVQGAGDVRNGSAAQISLVYLIMPIRNEAGLAAGFAASSCLHVSQHVRIPRLERGGRIAYTVAPTWSSCSLLVGDSDSYEGMILRNADEQTARFLKAWRAVNGASPIEPIPSRRTGEMADTESPAI